MLKTGAERRRCSRAKLHATDHRPKRTGVLDGRPSTFLREVRRQSKLIAGSGASTDALEFLDRSLHSTILRGDGVIAGS
jgi:hypothetical protein